VTGPFRLSIQPRAAALFAAVLLTAGCGAAATATPSPTATSTPTAEPTATPLALIREPVSGIVQNTVTYAGIEFTAKEAFLSNQGPRDYADDVASPEPTEISHLFIVVSGRNTTQHQPLLDAEILSLVLADGTIIEPTDLFGRGEDFMRPATGAAADGFVAFEVEPGLNVSGASLRIGKAPDRPAVLLLTSAQPAPEYPVTLQVSGEARGIGVTNGGKLLYTLLGGGLHADNPLEAPNNETGWRANEDELFLVLDIRILMEEGRVEGTFKEQFRLIVGGAPREPWNSPEGGSFGPGAAVDTKVGWLIPASTTDIVLQVGDPAMDPGTIPITLPGA
jgi:hypothetical protein